MPPNSLFESDLQLVSSTDAIVLARVIGLESAIYQPQFKRRKAVFHFETAEVIKGQPPSLFDLDGFVVADGVDASNDFNGHLNPEFWADHSANSIMPGDCKAYGIFSAGETYLIFLRQQPHVRSFENVRSQDDLWLRVVKLLVGSASSLGNGL